jgi:hypothetical protein
MQPVDQLPKPDGPAPEVTIPPMYTLALQSFERDLPEMLKTHYRKWVAYHGDKRIGFGRSETKLYQQCLDMGICEDEFLVLSVEPEIRDEDIFPNY